MWKNKEKQREWWKKYYAEHKEERCRYNKEYREKNTEKIKADSKAYRSTDEYKTKRQEYNKEYRERYRLELADIKKAKHRETKLKTMEEIAKYHCTDIKCWRCGETRIWVLTIGHPHNNGDEDRNKFGTGPQYYSNILKGLVDLSNVRIECMNCNACLEWYGKYPDEMSVECFLMTGSEVRRN